METLLFQCNWTALYADGIYSATLSGNCGGSRDTQLAWSWISYYYIRTSCAKNVETRHALRRSFSSRKFNLLMECVARGLSLNFSVSCAFWFTSIDVLHTRSTCPLNTTMLASLNRGVHRRNVLMSLSFLNNSWVVIPDYLIFRWSESTTVNGSRKFHVGESWRCFSPARYLTSSTVWLDLMNSVTSLEFHIFFSCTLWP